MDDLLIGKVTPIFPKIKKWIEKTLEENSSNAVYASSLDFSRIKELFSSDLLNEVRVVFVDGTLPYPPLVEMGLDFPLVIEREQRRKTIFARGVTLKNMIFIGEKHRESEDLLFHELVHAVQWKKLRVDRFLLAYGKDLIEAGYKAIFMEEMAYALQNKFKEGTLQNNFIEDIEQNAVEGSEPIVKMIQRLKGKEKYSFLRDLDLP